MSELGIVAAICAGVAGAAVYFAPKRRWPSVVERVQRPPARTFGLTAGETFALFLVVVLWFALMPALVQRVSPLADGLSSVLTRASAADVAADPIHEAARFVASARTRPSPRDTNAHAEVSANTALVVARMPRDDQRALREISALVTAYPLRAGATTRTIAQLAPAVDAGAQVVAAPRGLSAPNATPMRVTWTEVDLDIAGRTIVTRSCNAALLLESRVAARGPQNPAGILVRRVTFACKLARPTRLPE
jgi:hypothetical protein